jgi:hypothetical protein
MSITKLASKAILDYNFGTTVYTPATTLYLGLSKATIAFDGTGLSEPSGAYGYTRMPIVNTGKVAWTVATDAGLLSNINEILFPEDTGTDWGTIVQVFLAASSVVGTADVWYFENITSKLVQVGTQVIFAAGALQISMTNT